MHTADVLTPQASEFLMLLQREFGDEREELLAERQARAARLRAGELPDFLDDTRIRPRGRAGGCRRRPPTCRTAASRSPGRPIARW